MRKTYVLMTALPPTIGHAALIDFALGLGHPVEVVHGIEGDVPFAEDITQSLRYHFYDAPVMVHAFYEKIPQTEEEFNDRGGYGVYPNFWKMWKDILLNYGMEPGDYLVASEPYGARLAEEVGAVFMPFDMGRVVVPVKATNVRQDIYNQWDKIIPEFRQRLQTTVTLFGAESVGKTTMALNCDVEPLITVVPEWARDYLEQNGPELNREVMMRIVEGQTSLQSVARRSVRTPLVVQDTDLFSTIGYWELHEDEFGPVPEGLIDTALLFKSDMYYVLSVDRVEFEPDVLRYGGDKRETGDKYWIDLLERFDLPYEVVYTAEQDVHISRRLTELTKYKRRYND